MLRHLAAAALLLGSLLGATLARAEPRLALVIGQGAYAAGELATAVNDAALVGQTLTSAGFEVVQGRDLNQADLRRIVRDFLDGVQTATPDASVVVYVAGHALQVEGEDYVIPTDARIARESDIPIEGYRVSDIVRALSSAPGATRVVILDTGREYPLPAGAQGIARGLALMEPPPGFLVAFAAAPGTTAPEGPGPYGPYATALVEMMREPGLPLDALFARVRLRVHEATGGRQTPWHAANLSARFVFFEPVDAAAAPPSRPPRAAAASAEEAYALAVEQDTISAYQEFLRLYPNHSLARRVKLLLAARREAVVWRRTVVRNTPEAYWTYLRRYPGGPHAADARRRLSRLSVPLSPPPDFDEVVYRDVPPPAQGEIVEVRERIYFDDDLPPPPRAPVYLLPERDEYVTRLEAPPPAPARGILPIPIPIPIPIRARPPAEFRPPIAPITPQGPVTIPVAPPPVQGRPGGPGPFGGRPGPGAGSGFGQASPQPGQPQPGAVPGQPGLRAPITPLVGQAQPGTPGAAAPGGPATAPGGPAVPPTLAPGAAPDARPGRPGSLPPAAGPGQPGSPAPGTLPGPGARP
ncbi:MAG TPA: caspase family protein, partial [Beijerinckiaceae bacterium]